LSTLQELVCRSIKAAHEEVNKEEVNGEEMTKEKVAAVETPQPVATIPKKFHAECPPSSQAWSRRPAVPKLPRPQDGGPRFFP